MEKKTPKNTSGNSQHHFLAPIFRLAKLFEIPKTDVLPKEQSSESLTQLQNVHTNYLEYRTKTEAVIAASRTELDKTILSISMQGMAFTFAIVNALRPPHHWQIEIAWLLWTGAIFVTLLSLLIAEYAAEKFKSILDDSYDLAEAEGIAILPVSKALEKRSPFIRWFISSNNHLMNLLNYLGPVLFMAAVIFVLWWMLLIKGV